MENNMNGIGVGIEVECGEPLCEESKAIVQECARRIAQAQARFHAEQERREQERLDRIMQAQMEQEQAKRIAQDKDGMRQAIIVAGQYARECGEPFDETGLLQALESGDFTKLVRFFKLS